MVRILQIVTVVSILALVAVEVWVLQMFMNWLGTASFVVFTLLVGATFMWLGNRSGGSSGGGNVDTGRRRSKGARKED